MQHLGHGGNFKSVRDVIVYKNAAVSQNTNVPNEKLAGRFEPLGLSEEEIDDLTRFIEISLSDNNLERYVPISTPTGQCFPNADEESRKDLGCE